MQPNVPGSWFCGVLPITSLGAYIFCRSMGALTNSFLLRISNAIQNTNHTRSEGSFLLFCNREPSSTSKQTEACRRVQGQRGCAGGLPCPILPCPIPHWEQGACECEEELQATACHKTSRRMCGAVQWDGAPRAGARGLRPHVGVITESYSVQWSVVAGASTAL
jgi:hypothetical protein